MKDISVVIPVFNECARITSILRSVYGSFSDIIVFDKGSTDGTIDEVTFNFPHVRIVSIPFSNRGEEDFNYLLSYCKTDWVFVVTASEVVSGELINKIISMPEEFFNKYDLIYVPRKFYSLGFHNPKSPWSITHYPFFFNKNTVIITNVIHQHFSCEDRRREYYLSADDGVVYHITHNNVEKYMNDMISYMKAEVKNINKKDIDQQYFDRVYKQFSIYAKRMNEGNSDFFGQYCAWSIYWHGVMLFAWEKSLSEDITSYNKYLLDFFSEHKNEKYPIPDKELSSNLNKIKLKHGIKQTMINHVTILYRKYRTIPIVRVMKEKMSWIIK
ncbi:hypothetical protein CF141_05060 [Aeromonas hydrophila]|uniref:glycosyltransferase n=1 Tax=Aeromonas hydrophila TaxID=644 RepID=UPI00111793D1|nr:glycosyltransferase [Aeromonas hydrophila]TNH77689.1 hypothetical protein CF141_05060 [Aeromonas hydrophila]